MQFEKTYTREFFKDFELQSSFDRTRAISVVFEQLTVRVFSKLHKKPYTITHTNSVNAIRTKTSTLTKSAQNYILTKHFEI